MLIGTNRVGSRRERGFSLIEGLVALLVFSVGALGLIEMQARAVQLSTEAHDRANASLLVNRLFAEVALKDTVDTPDPSEKYLLSRTACTDGISTSHPAYTWTRQVCAEFDDASIIIERPAGVAAYSLMVTLEWAGRYKNKDGSVVTRDPRRHQVTNRFHWQ